MANRSTKLIKVDHEDIMLRTFILFVQTGRAVMKYADTLLYRKADISIIRLTVLQVLAYEGRKQKLSDIAEWTQTERHNITTLIKRMEQDGLVKTEHNSDDRRLVHVTITDRGREVLSQAMPVAEEVVDRVMSSIAEGDATLLEKTLRVLRQNTHDGLEHVAKRTQHRQHD